MKFNYAFSPANKTFYSYRWKSEFDESGTWPSDAVDVFDDVFQKYSSNPPSGMMLGVDIHNMPEWVEIPPPPPPTPEQLQQQAESQKRQLLKTAGEKIDICQDAVDLDMSTDAEKSKLTAWRKYRVLLNRVDCTTAPDIQWPEQPE
ncbi:tail fiber assembly protein [Xenorhabdus kozodoii]|uniref:Phage tail fiber assembly n=1 Tax=Xenorhabdus kozodoii TaxID=351676 RepID=A0A2D0LEZ5_9GAMM|nr:tail fiber assembly protein [Xenorhabdus kozodoii]PHM74284.1 phage tail fiber assembly [Xenorhabdus kozodoii]